jgi:biopolymer transport protein TolQ
MFLSVGNALWSLLSQADIMTKAILGLLLITSIISWTFIFYKFIITTIKKKQIILLESKLLESMTLQEYSKIIAENRKNYGAYLLHKELEQGALFLSRGNERLYHQLDYSMFDEQVELLLEEYNAIENRYLPFLAMVSSSAPFVGLLGTVWGLTHSFISISERQMADIVTIAPGIAEAFLTTLAGLMVAIPALVMYHYFKSQAEGVMTTLERIAHQAKRAIYRTYLSSKGN